MITYDDKLKNAILALRKILVDSNYDLLVKEMKLPLWYFRDPGFIHYGHSIDNRLNKLNKPYELLLRLFSLNQAVNQQEVIKNLFSKELIKDMVDLGLLVEEDNKLQTDAYAIVPFLGSYLIATSGTARSIGAYIGRQSYFLATRLFEQDFDSFLDMGSGCGLLAILAAHRAKKVVGVDILSEAVEVGKTNAVLNQVDDRVEFFCGDMYHPVKGQNFDAIFSNVPFLALPEKYNLVSISSGEDGLRFLQPLIDGLFRHQPKIATIIANGLGNEQQPLLVNLLKNKLLNKRSYQAKLLVYSKGLIDDAFINSGVKMVVNACRDRGENISDEEIIQELKENYQKLKVDHYYGIILEIENKMDSAEIETIDISNKYNLNMSPSLRQKISFDLAKQILLKRDSSTLPISEQEKEIFLAIKNNQISLKEKTANSLARKLELVLGAKPI